MAGNVIQEVNIEVGDDVSRALYEASQLTHENRPGMLVEFHKSFSGARAMPLGMLPDPSNLYMNLGFDGVGTKVEVAERQRDHSTVAFDLFAMVCDDAVVRGAEPVAIGSILDVRHLKDTQETRTAITQLASGYVQAAEEAGVVIVNGEVAELGDRIGGFREIQSSFKRLAAFLLRRELPDKDFNYNWGAAVLWLAHKDRILTGHQIKPGDALVGFKENGFRSNGITDVRKAMHRSYGPEWHQRPFGETTYGEIVQTPSTIYSRIITELTGGYNIEKQAKAEVTGVAHITGGGQPSKLARMLEPSGLGALINEPFELPEIMIRMQILRGLDDRTAYGKWHMGPGMVVATPEPDKVIAEAEHQGKEAQLIGEVTREPVIRIRNKGVQSREAWLDFPVAP